MNWDDKFFDCVGCFCEFFICDFGGLFMVFDILDLISGVLDFEVFFIILFGESLIVLMVMFEWWDLVL